MDTQHEHDGEGRGRDARRAHKKVLARGPTFFAGALMFCGSVVSRDMEE